MKRTEITRFLGNKNILFAYFIDIYVKKLETCKHTYTCQRRTVIWLHTFFGKK